MNRHALPALVLALAACQPGSAVTAPPPPTAAANVAAANVVPSPPPVLELGGATAQAQLGALTTVLASRGETTVPPRASFRVELRLRLADARLSLLDGGDAFVPSSGEREVGAVTVLTLRPEAPLAPGAGLRLRVDGAASLELHGEDGRRYAPVEWQVLVAGEPEPARGRSRKRR